jgi:hypothetical protein
MTPELAVVRHPDHVQWLGVVEGCGSHRNTFSFLIYYIVGEWTTPKETSSGTMVCICMAANHLAAYYL